MLFEYLFLLQVKTSDSCHVQLKHNPPKCPNYNSELRPTLSTILQGLFAPTCRTSTHESFLNILNFISLKLNLLSFHSDLFIFFYNGKTPFQIPESASKSQQDPLQLLLYIFHIHRPGSHPCYLFPVTGITFLLTPMPSLHGAILNTARAIF